MTSLILAAVGLVYAAVGGFIVAEHYTLSAFFFIAAILFAFAAIVSSRRGQ